MDVILVTSGITRTIVADLGSALETQRRGTNSVQEGFAERLTLRPELDLGEALNAIVKGFGFALKVARSHEARH